MGEMPLVICAFCYVNPVALLCSGDAIDLIATITMVLTFRRLYFDLREPRPLTYRKCDFVPYPSGHTPYTLSDFGHYSEKTSIKYFYAGQ